MIVQYCTWQVKHIHVQLLDNVYDEYSNSYQSY